MWILAANPVFDAYRSSDFFGKIIFIGLFALSIATWIVIFQKWRTYREAKRKADKLNALLQKIRLNPLGFETGNHTGPFSEIYRSLKQNTLELLSKNKQTAAEKQPVYLSHSDIQLLEGQLFTTISSQTQLFEKNLFILSTIVSLAPFLGLLGTVWGILITFSELQTGAAVNANAAVMGGLAMALGTTVIGLVVAIPALIGYNYLKSAIQQFSAEMEDFSHSLVSAVELHYRKVDV